MQLETQVEVLEGEIAPLCAALGCSPEQLPSRMSEIGRAALREYVEMLLGENVVRSPENRERRLLYWILYANSGSIPNEEQVSRIFNITTSSARSLLRTVISRYRKQMSAATEVAAKGVLSACGTEDSKGIRRVSVSNPVIVEYLNDRLAQHGGKVERVRLETNTSSTYMVHGDTFTILAEVLQWQP